MIIRFKENRVRREYAGGKNIDKFAGKEVCVGSKLPEEWLASAVEAFNPDFEPIENEGLSICENGEFFKTVLEKNSEKILGKRLNEKYNGRFSMLVKLLDSAERLLIQCHPTVSFAKKEFNSDFGKTECWYFLDTQEDACVYLGFKEGITKEKWKFLFENQDREGMLACLHKFSVKPNELWFVDGGVPHAIGKGCFMIELQEPSDLTVLTERVNVKGDPVCEVKLHGGLGFEKMFDCFVYEGMSEAQVRQRYYKKAVFEENQINCLVDETLTDKFSMKCLRVNGEFSANFGDTYAVCIVINGECVLNSEEREISLEKGQSFLVGANSEKLEFKGKADIVFCIG